MDIHLKIKSESGEYELVVNDSASIKDLLKEIEKLTGIALSALELRIGFPPKIVDVTKPNKLLLDCQIRSGDAITVRKRQLESIPKDQFDVTLSRLANNPVSAQSDGILMRKVVPADNSCLFNSIHFCVTGVLTPTAKKLRQIVSNSILSSPEIYNDALLGKSGEDYAAWIQKDSSWGGAIELSILSGYCKIQICVVDIQNAVLNKFGEDKKYEHQMFLIYDGIHYDPLYLELYEPSGEIQTIFSVYDDGVLIQAQQIGEEARCTGQFTNTSQFALMCTVCGAKLLGQLEAHKHADATSHCNFTEVRL